MYGWFVWVVAGGDQVIAPELAPSGWGSTSWGGDREAGISCRFVAPSARARLRSTGNSRGAPRPRRTGDTSRRGKVAGTHPKGRPHPRGGGQVRSRERRPGRGRRPHHGNLSDVRERRRIV